MKNLILTGMVPEPPTILCRDDDASLNIQYALHEEWAQKPPVFVMEHWPEEWKHVNAVVVTPIHVIGTERATSFSIEGEISDEARRVLNAYINLIRTSGVPPVGYSGLSKSTGFNRRTITAALKELTAAGIGAYKYGTGFSLDIGRWVVDAERAKAFGLDIKEYR